MKYMIIGLSLLASLNCTHLTQCERSSFTRYMNKTFALGNMFIGETAIIAGTVLSIGAYTAIGNAAIKDMVNSVNYKNSIDGIRFGGENVKAVLKNSDAVIDLTKKIGPTFFVGGTLLTVSAYYLFYKDE